ncbi:BQ5605_C002g01014 [Microbotryum silenes-dioicae]|uniref:BQ5605_C002g01014 protein n=1 Tax=Microbotryum silenes-dioicae TaxID=796604 RepID=A0A2X0NV91_9BASI|nr:BQ5605_C002g01014 [Microbotryum silenes-dioicae]
MMETAWDRDLESGSRAGTFQIFSEHAGKLIPPLRTQQRTQQLVVMYPQNMSERKVTKVCSLFHALQSGVSLRSSKQTSAVTAVRQPPGRARGSQG